STEQDARQAKSNAQLRRVNGWWRKNDKDAYDWSHVFGLLQHHFPSLDVKHMTLDVMADRLKTLNKLMGYSDKPEVEKKLTPDEWFAKVLAGEIEANPDNAVVAVPELAQI